MTTHGSPRRGSASVRAEAELRRVALGYPEAIEDHPWGHSAFKIRGKVFLFLALDAQGLGLSVKLPDSGVDALDLAYTEPTGYGLGKSGWVSARFEPDEPPPIERITAWIDESFRAVAPKRVVAALDGAAPAPAPEAKAPKSASPGKATARKAARRASKKSASKKSALKKSAPKKSASKQSAKRAPKRKA